jgi:hypothetical protein
MLTLLFARYPLSCYTFTIHIQYTHTTQSLAADLGRATLEIPFSIPPYFALVARALGILEGIALTGDEDYRIVLEVILNYNYVMHSINLNLLLFL